MSVTTIIIVVKDNLKSREPSKTTRAHLPIYYHPETEMQQISFPPHQKHHPGLPGFHIRCWKFDVRRCSPSVSFASFAVKNPLFSQHQIQLTRLHPGWLISHRPKS